MKRDYEINENNEIFCYFRLFRNPSAKLMHSFYERYWRYRADEQLSERDFALKWPKLQSYIPRKRGITVVDFGCGNGELLAKMETLNPGASYIGLDLSAVALNSAAARYPQMKFHRIVESGEIPLESGSADFVLSSEVIEHIYDTENAFGEIARILRPGGRLLLTTPYHGLIKNLLTVTLGFDKHFDPLGPHIRFFSKRSLFVCLKRVGLEPLEHGYYGRFYPVPHSIVVLAEKGGTS
jgi:SAM-dependent methyltransferase